MRDHSFVSGPHHVLDLLRTPRLSRATLFNRHEGGRRFPHRLHAKRQLVYLKRHEYGNDPTVVLLATAAEIIVGAAATGRCNRQSVRQFSSMNT